MSDVYNIRLATLEDISFLVKAIIEAEKSGTSKLGLATLFQLTEAEVGCYLAKILEEEIDGCEFSVSSFLLATLHGEPVAAMAGWLEGENEDKMPSALLKANLLSYVLPSEKLIAASTLSSQLKDIQIDREINTYQIEYVYVSPLHRGQGLTQKLIEAHKEKGLSENNSGMNKMQVQAFANNQRAIKTYEKKGFHIVKEYRGSLDLLDYLPDNIKLLFEKID